MLNMDLKASINSIPYLQYMTEQLPRYDSKSAAGLHEETGSEEESCAAADPNSYSALDRKRCSFMTQ